MPSAVKTNGGSGTRRTSGLESQGDAGIMVNSYARHEDAAEEIVLEGRVVRPLVTQELGARNLLLSTGVYEAGRSIPYHKHQDEEEAIYVISGTGEIAIGDRIEPLKPGSAAFIPPGVEHQLRVRSGESMRLVFVFSPPTYPGSYERAANGSRSR